MFPEVRAPGAGIAPASSAFRKTLGWSGEHLFGLPRGRGTVVRPLSGAVLPTPIPSVAVDAAALYLDLMKGALTRSLFLDEEVREVRDVRPKGVRAVVERAVRKRGYRIVRVSDPVDIGCRKEGRDWPATAETMIGRVRLDNVQHCIETVLAESVPGDFIETGVWRGGATILMRAVLAAHGITERRVWVADSFQGLPAPDVERYPADEGDIHWTYDPLAVDVETVRRNFERYGLLDDQVRFLEGWFADTLPTAPIERLAVARLDGDMYSSTWDAITVLYPKLSPGGFLIVDDYANSSIEGCRRAIDDYRIREGITDPIEPIDWTGVYWRKS
jgi:O-methyltransferase